MTLLEFARGPLLAVALLTLFGGSIWRIYGIFRFQPKADYSKPRSEVGWLDALRGVGARVFPRKEFRPRIAFTEANAWLYHIGLLLVVVGYAPHIAFVKRLTGFITWPALPDAVTYFCGAMTIVTLIIALLHRMSHPPLRVLSNFDDYFSWFITLFAVVTGMMAFDYSSARTDTVLAIHLMAVEALLIWLPFGKLSHAFLVFISRGITGAAFARKGASL
jgi:nitrate reductase gamma subunit